MLQRNFRAALVLQPQHWAIKCRDGRRSIVLRVSCRSSGEGDGAGDGRCAADRLRECQAVGRILTQKARSENHQGGREEVGVKKLGHGGALRLRITSVPMP